MLRHPLGGPTCWKRAATLTYHPQVLSSRPLPVRRRFLSRQSTTLNRWLNRRRHPPMDTSRPLQRRLHHMPQNLLLFMMLASTLTRATDRERDRHRFCNSYSFHVYVGVVVVFVRSNGVHTDRCTPRCSICRMCYWPARSSYTFVTYWHMRWCVRDIINYFYFVLAICCHKSMYILLCYASVKLGLMNMGFVRWLVDMRRRQKLMTFCSRSRKSH